MQKIIIITDGDCVLCRHLRLFLQIKKHYQIQWYDLRADTDVVEIYRAKGYDADRGMIIDIDGQIYHGAMALTVLHLIAEVSWRQKSVLMVVSYPGIARLVYPVLLWMRKMMVKK